MDANTSIIDRENSPVDIWDPAYVADELDRVFAEANGNEELVMSYIPSLFGTSVKARYLGFRAVGLTVQQALDILQLGPEALQIWREETPEIIEFEYKHLPKLQAHVGADIVRLGFLRNMTMFIFRDQTIIQKMLSGMEGLTPREFAYGKSVRRFYSPSDLLAMEKAINPEKHRTQVVALQFNNQTVFELVEDDDGENMTMVERPNHEHFIEQGSDQPQP